METKLTLSRPPGMCFTTRILEEIREVALLAGYLIRLGLQEHSLVMQLLQSLVVQALSDSHMLRRGLR